MVLDIMVLALTLNNFNCMILQDKVALITGGSKGIGRTIVETLARQGCRVVAISRSLDELKILQNELNAVGLTIVIKEADVSDYEQVKKVVQFVIEKFHTIDILVNAAGVYGPIGQFDTNDICLWTKTIQINLVGTAHCTHAVLPIMLKNKAGKIINFSGGGAVNTFPNFSSYATSKAAVVRFTETIAEEYKSYNIQINAIAPGAVNTRLLDESLEAGAKMVGEKFYEKIVNQKKDGGDSPQLAADLTAFLVSDRSLNLTGKLISAKWDSWNEWNEVELERLKKSSELTLRRIDNKYFQEIIK